MKRSLSLTDVMIGVLMGSTMTVAMVDLILGPRTQIVITLPGGWMKVGLMPVPPLDDVASARPWPTPNECIYEFPQPYQPYPPFWMHDVDLPMLPPAPPSPKPLSL